MNFYPSEAALVIQGKNRRLLAVADLHIGFERAFLDAKIAIPNQSRSLLNRLLELVDQVKVSEVILLGDIKHQLTYMSFKDWTQVPHFLDRLQQKVRRVVVIPGNHDAGLRQVSSGVFFASPRGLTVQTAGGPIGLIHGHSWPLPRLFSAHSMIVGHVHPTIELQDASGLRMVEPVWLRARVDEEVLARSFLKSSGIPDKGSPMETFRERFKTSFELEEVLIMPAFNRLLAGRPVNAMDHSKAPFIGPILKSGGVSLDDAEVFMLDATYLGELENLRTRGKEHTH